MLPAYAELHCLSNFSFLRGASHPEELVERAHALGYAALAHHRRVLARRRRARASGGEGLRAAARHRQRVHAGRRREARAARAPTARATATWRSSSRAAGATRPRARYALTRDDVAALAAGLLALWVPPDRRSRRRRGDALDHRRAGSRDVSRPRWIAVELAVARRRPRAARRARRAGAGERAAAGRRRRRPHARARPPRAAGHADGDPPAHAARRMRLRALPERRAAPALARAPRHDLSAGDCWPRRSPIAERCTFSLDELRYEYPEEIVPPGRDAGVAPARAGRGRAARGGIGATAFPKPCPPTSAS